MTAIDYKRILKEAELRKFIINIIKRKNRR
jgi:hypothetical protein